MECSLGKGELMTLTGGRRGITLRCLKGTIWLTIGDGRDYLVREGSSLELPEDGLALAEALQGAEIRLEAPANQGAKTAASGKQHVIGAAFLPRLT